MDTMNAMETVNYPVCNCERCGYVWVSSSTNLPNRCANPKCRSPYWQFPVAKPCVYLREGKPGLHKIGSTINLRIRLAGLLHGIIAVISTDTEPQARELEALIHRLFHSARVDKLSTSEWFQLTEAQIETFKRIDNEENPIQYVKGLLS